MSTPRITEIIGYSAETSGANEHPRWGHFTATWADDAQKRFEAWLAEHDRQVIEADRAQRNLIECIAEALDDRGAKDAAQLVRDTDPDDDLWNNYVGPMLDSIEDDYTRMAREIKETAA